MQLYPPILFIQVAPCLHGFVAHSLASERKIIKIFVAPNESTAFILSQQNKNIYDKRNGFYKQGNIFSIQAVLFSTISSY